MRLTKRLTRHILPVILGIVAFLLLPALSVYADQVHPSPTPTAEFDVYRNLLEAGDFLLIIYANIPYSSIPPSPVTDSFIWRLLDTDNITELGSTIGTNYNDSGYNYNVFSMYFSAASAPTWYQSYPVRLSGNPLVFSDPPDYDLYLSLSDYSLWTISALEKSALTRRIKEIADDLYTEWSLTSSTSLTVETEGGTYLSTRGESFFRQAIYGLQALAPDLFSLVPLDVEGESRTYSTTYITSLSQQASGTWVNTAQTAGADLWGTSYDLTSIILTLIMVFGVILGYAVITGNAYGGLILGTVVAILLARLNLYELSFLAFIAALCWLYISAKVFGMVR